MILKKKIRLSIYKVLLYNSKINYKLFNRKLKVL